MPKRKALDDDSSSDSSPTKADLEAQEDEIEGIFDVEVITAIQVSEDKSLRFKVKWDGYSSDYDTWEPLQNVEQCDHLLKKLWKEIGKKRKNEVGIHEASPKWIKRQRARYQKVKADDKKKDTKKKLDGLRAEKRARADSEKKAKKRDDSFELPSESEAEPTSSEDEKPIRNLTKRADMKSLSNAPSTSSASAKSTPAQAQVKGDMKKPVPPGQSSRPVASRSKYQTLSFRSTQKSQLKDPKVNVPLLPGSKSQISIKTVPVSSKSSSDQSNRKEKRTPIIPSSEKMLPTQHSHTVPVPETRVSMIDVDNFLATAGVSFEQVGAQKPGSSLTKPQITSVPRQLIGPSKWIWSGDLVFGTADKAETLCQAKISETLESTLAGFTFKVLLADKDTLRFSKAYAPWEFKKIVSSLGDIEQLSRITYSEERDREALESFIKYLELRKLVVTTGAISNFGHVAEYIIFPASDERCFNLMKIPRKYAKPGQLLIAIAKWDLAPSKYNSASLLRDEIRDADHDMKMVDFRKKFAAPLNVEINVRMLGLTDEILSFMPTRHYCIWHPDPTTRAPGGLKKERYGWRQETRALEELMTHLKAVRVEPDNMSARVVFVHVGALRSLRKMPRIAQRRHDGLEFRFVTYGTHECVHPSIWGCREIFPLGGVVTFTANALLEDRLGVERVVQIIHRHPHWICYVLPSVLAVFIRMTCFGDSPISVYERFPSAFGHILDIIHEGKLAFCEAPSLVEQPQPQELSGPEQWIEATLMHMMKAQEDYVRDGWDRFDKDFANISEDGIATSIQKEIVNDLTRLQMQPSIHNNHRRFVVIRSDSEANIARDKDGFEWRTVNDFDFRDGFGGRSVPHSSVSL